MTFYKEKRWQMRTLKSRLVGTCLVWCTRDEQRRARKKDQIESNGNRTKAITVANLPLDTSFHLFETTRNIDVGTHTRHEVARSSLLR